MTKPVYVDGQKRSIEELQKAYEKYENSPALNAEAVDDERDISDPLGLNTKKKRSADPFEAAKVVAERITKFIMLAAAEEGLDPENVIFAVELSALNTLNADDCPLKGAAQDRVREAAFKYYKESITKLKR